MKWTIALAAVLMFSALSFHTPAYCQAQARVSSGIDEDNGDASKLTPQEKAASDSLMKQGLGQLQTAQSDLQGNNAAGAAEALKSAFESMRQAKPIYHGHRKDALMDTRRAERNIEANKKNSAERAAGFLNSAISEAQTALSTN